MARLLRKKRRSLWALGSKLVSSTAPAGYLAWSMFGPTGVAWTVGSLLISGVVLMLATDGGPRVLVVKGPR